MKVITCKQGCYFIGLVSELKEIFRGYPPETTLKEFIKQNLN